MLAPALERVALSWESWLKGSNICAKYAMNTSNSPKDSLEARTSLAPNQVTATVLAARISEMTNQ
jgi:hypothetical protein